MKILVTCPPMLLQMNRLQSHFQDRGWSATTPEFAQTLSVEELCRLVPDHDGWIIGDDPAVSAVVEAGRAGQLKAAVKWGAGTDNVQFEAFERAGIPVTNTPGMFGHEVADVALGYLIGLARHTFEIHQGILAGGWPKPTGTSLKEKRVALVGYGDIGRQLTHRLLACGMYINLYDPFVAPDALADSKRMALRAWPEGLGECDFLCFTCALTEANRHMLGKSALASAKEGLRIVNVARGGLIDEVALLEAQQRGTVAAVALDVFEEEPLTGDNPLRNFPQNVFGSHNSSNTLEAVLRTSENAIARLGEFLH